MDLTELTLRLRLSDVVVSTVVLTAQGGAGWASVMSGTVGTAVEGIWPGQPGVSYVQTILTTRAPRRLGACLPRCAHASAVGTELSTVGALASGVGLSVVAGDDGLVVAVTRGNAGRSKIHPAVPPGRSMACCAESSSWKAMTIS